LCFRDFDALSLTPALSRWERENASPRRENPLRPPHSTEPQSRSDKTTVAVDSVHGTGRRNIFVAERRLKRFLFTAFSKRKIFVNRRSATRSGLGPIRGMNPTATINPSLRDGY
jgi:hypothetical protein